MCGAFDLRADRRSESRRSTWRSIFWRRLTREGCSTWRVRRIGRAHGSGHSMSRVECRRRVPSGVDQYTSVSASRDGRRIVATVANPSASLWRVPLQDRIVDDQDAQPYPLPVQTGRALAPRFGGTSLFYLSARGPGDGLWKVQDGRASEVWRGVDGALSEPPAVSPDGRRLAVVVRREGKRHLSIMSADGTNPQTLAASIEIEGAAGQGAADWSPDGTRIVTGGRDAKGPGLFIIPVDTGVPARLRRGPVGQSGLVAGWQSDCLCRSVRRRPGRTSWSATGWHGCRVAARDGPAGRLSLPARRQGLGVLATHSGAGFLAPRFRHGEIPSSSRSLSNQGALRTFDITPDGKSIVFDRSRQNSNIVLIELPK